MCFYEIQESTSKNFVSSCYGHKCLNLCNNFIYENNSSLLKTITIKTTIVGQKNSNNQVIKCYFLI